MSGAHVFVRRSKIKLRMEKSKSLPQSAGGLNMLADMATLVYAGAGEFLQGTRSASHDAREAAAWLGYDDKMAARMEDGHDTHCACCSKKGHVGVCDGCPRVYHLECVPQLDCWPPGLWFCPVCVLELAAGMSLKRPPIRRAVVLDSASVSDDDDEPPPPRKRRTVGMTSVCDDMAILLGDENLHAETRSYEADCKKGRGNALALRRALAEAMGIDRRISWKRLHAHASALIEPGCA